MMQSIQLRHCEPPLGGAAIHLLMLKCMSCSNIVCWIATGQKPLAMTPNGKLALTFAFNGCCSC